MTNNHDHPVDKLKQLLCGAQLPALPQSAIRLLELSKDPENGPAEFAVPIEADPGLTSQVLRFVNSSYFGFSREISTVKLAITLVGIRTIKNFALWSAVFSLMPNPRCGSLDLKRLWQDSLRRGLFARSLGKLLGLKDAEEPFAAALLQDMAVPLLAKELSDRYADLVERREGGQVKLSDLERDSFGWTHAQAGALIAENWNLPDGFAQLIANHNQPEEQVETSGRDPSGLAVALSSLLPATCDASWFELPRFEAIYRSLCGLELPPLESFLARIDGEVAEFAPVLDLAAPAKTLVASYQEAHEPTAVAQ
ncbi:MAG: HDOD domain-containing protein [Pirellulales bacterium]